MIVEIMGSRAIKVNGKVKVLYLNSREVIYDSKTIDHLILNGNHVANVQILKNEE